MYLMKSGRLISKVNDFCFSLREVKTSDVSIAGRKGAYSPMLYCPFHKRGVRKSHESNGSDNALTLVSVRLNQYPNTGCHKIKPPTSCRVGASTRIMSD